MPSSMAKLCYGFYLYFLCQYSTYHKLQTQWVQNIHATASGITAPGATTRAGPEISRIWDKTKILDPLLTIYVLAK